MNKEKKPIDLNGLDIFKEEIEKKIINYKPGDNIKIENNTISIVKRVKTEFYMKIDDKEV